MVERYVRDVEATGSNPATSTTSERVTLVPIFLLKNQSPAPRFLLFRKKSAAPTLLACKRALGAPACYQLFAGSNLFQNFSQASFSLSIDTRLGLDAVRVRTLFFLSRQSARAESAAKVSTSKASARNSRAGLFSFCPGKVPTPEQSSLCSGLFFACG